MTVADAYLNVQGKRDDDLVCGESYDHDLMLIDERDGYRTYECRGCGAEVVEEPEDGGNVDA